LEDCFNGPKTIKFEVDGEGMITKMANMMSSLDGEIVKFNKNFNCVGEVEDWLRELEGHVSATLKYWLNE
jgi:hypothetical protein